MGWFKRLRKPIAEYTALEEPEERQAGLLFPGGAYKKSDEARRKLIQEDERHFGKDCYEAKKRKEDVARTLLEQGKYDDAEKMYYEIVQENENRPYEGYFMLTAKFRLGQTLYEQGKYQTARKVLQEVAKKRERMLGKSHHDTLDSKQWLAGITVAERKEAQKAQSQKAIHGKEGMAGMKPNENKNYEAEKASHQSIQGRDPLLGQDDTTRLGLKSEREPPLRRDQKRHQKRRQKRRQKRQSSSQEAERDYEKTLSNQSSRNSVSPTHSLPLVRDTVAMAEEQLDTFFSVSTEGRQSYNDSEISQIGRLLRQTHSAWSRVPRTYIILRTIDCLQHLDQIIELNEFFDYMLPVNQAGVPDCLSPKMRNMFLNSQKLILTQSMDLERGADGHHCHFAKGDSLPFDRIGYLGTGGFGEVDRILSHISFQEYARKRVPRKKAFGGRGVEALKSIIREIEAMKNLKHYHIVKFVGSYTDPKYLGVIMHPVAECDLFAYLERAGREDHAEIRTFFGCLATGLKFLHDSQFRHKDIKPQNILVKQGRVYLTDFGLSLDFEDATGSTTVGMVNYMTKRYCPPEVALWEPRNTLSDIWSLGLIFLEMIVILKGRTIEWMDGFLGDNGSYQTHVRSNSTGLVKLLTELKQTGSLSDNVALIWIQQMLQEKHILRPSAGSLVTSITQPNSNEGPETIFCGICCLAPDNSDSDDSDDIEEENFLRDLAFRTRV